MPNIIPALQALAVPIASLHPDPANARKHNDKNLDAIKASLAKFGQRKPVVVQREGMIVRAGNGTLAAAKALGWTEVAAVVLDDDNATASQFAIADNRTAELAEWDNETLATLLDGMGEQDRELLGFDADDMQELIGELTPEIVEDDVPEPPAEPITKPGNLWLLGDHRLLCGDSTKAEDVARLMGGEKADAVVTDPPYGMAFRSNHRNEKHQAISGDDDQRLLIHATKIYAQHSKYIWCRWDNVAVVEKPRSLVTWVKNNWSMGDLDHEHARQTEVCLFYPGPSHHWPGDRPRDVVTHDRTGNELHPTQKPVSLLAEVVQWTVGIVYDPFLGSGTTLIAAEQLGRKCYGMEISPAYCDVIVKRWETLTGKKAVLADG